MRAHAGMLMERRTLEASKRKGHRVVLLPELVHELLEGHERRVKLDPQRLGVIADGEVGGHRRRAATIYGQCQLGETQARRHGNHLD